MFMVCDCRKSRTEPEAAPPTQKSAEKSELAAAAPPMPQRSAHSVALTDDGAFTEDYQILVTRPTRKTRVTQIFDKLNIANLQKIRKFSFMKSTTVSTICKKMTIV